MNFTPKKPIHITCKKKSNTHNTKHRNQLLTSKGKNHNIEPSTSQTHPLHTKPIINHSSNPQEASKTYKSESDEGKGKSFIFIRSRTVYLLSETFERKIERRKRSRRERAKKIEKRTF